MPLPQLLPPGMPQHPGLPPMMPQMFQPPPPQQQPPPPQYHFATQPQQQQMSYPPPPVMHTQMDPAVLAHMRQQALGAATPSTAAALAALATAQGGKLAAGPVIDKKKLHFREAAGEKWVDVTLAEWPENDHRIFVGNLGSEVNDDLVTKAFMKYPSFNKAKVVKDRHSNKTKGYAFVSFQEMADMHKALKEMEGKYIGNRPVKLKKSTWDKREVEATPDMVESAVKRYKADPKLTNGRPKDRRKHVNILHK